MSSRASILLLACLLPILGCSTRPAPRLCFSPAPELKFPDYTDSNSPADWGSGKLRIFHGANTDSYSEGTSVEDLCQATSALQFSFPGGPETRWLEEVVRLPAPNDHRLYGIYHHEAGRFDATRCGAAGFDPSLNLGVAKVGVMVSDDDGLDWVDEGFVLSPPESDKNCDAQNGDFSAGNGDPEAVVIGDWMYIYYGNYGGPPETQGVSAARIRIADLDSPAGKAFKWDGRDFTVAGLGGRSTPLRPEFIPTVPWSGKVESFWGPSIHYNTALQTYVMLLNRTSNDGTAWFGQEGTYVSFSDDPARPDAWTVPKKYSAGPRTSEDEYPVIYGLGPLETNRTAGRSARYFEHGVSRWTVGFYRDDTAPKDCQETLPSSP